MKRGQIKFNSGFVSLATVFGNEKMKSAVKMFVIRLKWG